MNKAVYAGSFDPVTNGHLWMIKKGAKLFNELVVAVGSNPEKESTFSIEERVNMIKEVSYDIPNVTVDSFENQYLVHYAKDVKAQFMLRGIRNQKDYQFERGMVNVNEKLKHSILPVFLMPPKGMSETSSSLVKNLIGPEGWEEAIEEYVPRSVYNALLINFKGLENRWNSLWKRVNARGNPEEAYAELLNLYGEKQRHYHNLVHIVHSIREMDNAKNLIKNPDQLEFALWYHDAIYNVHAKDNEEKSAELAEKRLNKAGLRKQFIDDVTNLIIATKHKEIPQKEDAKYICDIDLANLGKSQKEFDRYGKDIRHEYKDIPEEQFKLGNAKILKGFFDRDYIYSTDFFRKKYEARTIKNLKRSLAK
jgi:pantetheine-phosphate adenylyltransferase